MPWHSSVLVVEMQRDTAKYFCYGQIKLLMPINKKLQDFVVDNHNVLATEKLELNLTEIFPQMYASTSQRTSITLKAME